jgi:hypothetical protein
MMKETTSQKTLPNWLEPEETAAATLHQGPRDAVINAHIGRGRDWVAYVAIAVPRPAPRQYWQDYPIKGCGRSKTILLAARCFYRARIGGQHFGVYISQEGHIHYFTQKDFLRELDCRFRQGIETVDFTCSGDWIGDTFSPCIPVANLGALHPDLILLRPARLK